MPDPSPPLGLDIDRCINVRSLFILKLLQNCTKSSKVSKEITAKYAARYQTYQWYAGDKQKQKKQKKQIRTFTPERR